MWTGSKVMGRFGRVDPARFVQHRFVGADVHDLAHQAAALGVVAHQAALHRHGQLVDERRVHKGGRRDVPAGPRHLVLHLAARHNAHIVAGGHLVRGGHAHGERSPCQNVGGGLVFRTDTEGKLLVIAHAAPGGVHGVGGAVFVPAGQNEHRLGIGPGFCSKIFAHGLVLLCRRQFAAEPPCRRRRCSTISTNHSTICGSW